jgi:hypothetical protein
LEREWQEQGQARLLREKQERKQLAREVEERRQHALAYVDVKNTHWPERSA